MLVGRLTTNPEVLGLFRLRESKGGKESNGKLPQNVVCQEQ